MENESLNSKELFFFDARRFEDDERSWRSGCGYGMKWKIFES